MSGTIRVYFEDSEEWVSYDKENLIEMATEGREYSDPHKAEKVLEDDIHESRYDDEESFIMKMSVVVGHKSTPEKIRKEQMRERLDKAQQ